MSRETWGTLGREASPVRERWRDRWETAPDAEARAGALFSQAVEQDPLPQHKLNAIAERLRHPRPLRQRALRRGLIVRLAAGLSLLVVGGALAATATRYFQRPIPFGIRATAPSAFTHAPRGHLRSKVAVAPLAGARSSIEEPAPSPVEQPAALPAELPVAPAAPLRAETPLPARAPPPALAPLPEAPPAIPSGLIRPPAAATDHRPSMPLARPQPATTSLAEESRLIMSALTALRRHDDAVGALATLDQHDLRFPRGELAEEAALARVEALVKENRSSEALTLLEARGAVRRGGNQRKLLLTRAELQAASGRCGAALDELDAVLCGELPADSLTERALWGRAACRASSGQPDLAQADLEKYLKLFPSGRFADRARTALKSRPRQ